MMRRNFRYFRQGLLTPKISDSKIVVVVRLLTAAAMRVVNMRALADDWCDKRTTSLVTRLLSPPRP